MTKFNELDSVALIVDLPDVGLVAGDSGAIVFAAAEEYLVDFDRDHPHIPVTGAQLRLVESLEEMRARSRASIHRVDT